MSAGLSGEERVRLEALFDQAAELPHGLRAAFVERECGPGGALRAELERLLAGLAGEDLLGRIQPQAPTRAGTRVGPYELLERLGEGGMGEVYAARQLEPLVRSVALKIIKPGMDSAQVLARFEAERRALARMGHTNIARILDGGATPDGRPYFAMELVEGAPITAHCDLRRLSTRARLELFLQVCDGVQHAHQKGVVHRDLKPSNLLVAEQDGRPVPKIIDFGIARAISGRLAERSLHTLLGQVVGTLDYMSPEQADPGGVDVDTRSDIYSLGVVLYQLVSGLLPFEHRLGAGVPLSEVQRVIRESDPPTPSTRLRRLTGTATALAPLHGTDERTLLRQIAGDLDWICLKALEKDPARRYQSASELAADVRRHLAHEPVLAARPGALYRARKFVRRHRVGVAASALVCASASAGIVGIVLGRIEAERLAVVAQESERHARIETAKVLRLSAIRTLRELEAEADALWPPHPGRIPALVDWERRARESVAERPLHLATLAEMRARALPYTLAEQVADQAAVDAGLAEPRAQLAALTARIDGGLADQALERVQRRVEDLRASIAARETSAGGRLTWSFELSEDRWWHATLVELLERLERLDAQLLAADATSVEHGWSVPRRIAAARELERGFAEDGACRAAWVRTREGLRDAYPGLDLPVQMGLVPLGPDPDSGLWEFAHLLSGEPAERGPDGRLVLTGETGLVLVLLPGGTFWMGAQRADPQGRNYDPQAQDWKEAPVHEVRVPPFFLAKHELTRGQWSRAPQALTDFNEHPNVESGLELPMTMVSWTQCDSAARRLGLALPHEEQWEYAARAGTTTVWSTGDEEASLEGYANLFDQSGVERFPGWTREAEPSDIRDGFAQLAPVGSLRPNAFGLHDVHGNADEWCANAPYAYGRPLAEMPGFESRSARGGSSRYAGLHARSGARRDGSRSFTYPTLGLRPARALDP